MVCLEDILLTLRTFLVGGKFFKESVFIGPAGFSSVGLGRLSTPADSFADLDAVVLDDFKLSCKRLIHVARMPTPTGADVHTKRLLRLCEQETGCICRWVPKWGCVR
jgi:hypothetical protein